MPLADDANNARRDLESHWISLLSWLGQDLGKTEDELVEGWNPDAYLSAKQRLVADTRGRTDVPWTVLSYLDIGSFVQIASRYGTDLERLGHPPGGWKHDLDNHLATGLVRNRNHLVHADRFGALPEVEQQGALTVFREQHRLLTEWWPQVPGGTHPLAPESHLRAALRGLSPQDSAADIDPEKLSSLVRSLGFRFIPNAPNLIPPAVNTDLAQALAGHASAVHRVGEAQLVGGSQVGFYAVYLAEWRERSSQRERHRRKVARAIVEYQSALDPRRLILLLDGAGRAREAELILPRNTGTRLNSTIRMTLSLSDPNHYHVELLRSLALTPGLSLPDLTRRWNEAFSVERVTRLFYEEFRNLRDRIIEALLVNNPHNPALRGRDPSTDHDFNLQLHAFATRQLGRLLFLWFLQQKRWLGNSPGDGDPNFLIKIFRERQDGQDYFNDVLVPLFFDGLGLRQQEAKHRAVDTRFGPVPFLGGGLFRPGADDFESRLLGLNDQGEPTIRVILPDDLFDPARDNEEVIVGRHRQRVRSVLGLLRGYRFTTQESTPDDQSVDPDPELLGKVFENLYQTDERHATGAYYTPREVVHFMCRETLDGYLEEKTSVSRVDLQRVRANGVEWDDERWLDTATSARLSEALDEVTILDPAVGSGAFLLASMQEIVLLKRGIEMAELERQIDRGSQDVAAWKQRVATHNLYGVDLNPMAVEICHLRLWLSMLVDLDISDFHDVPPLPNLDLRVVAGDSLIDRMGERPFIQSLPKGEVQIELTIRQEVATLQANIETLRQRFEGEGAATGDARRLARLKEQIRIAEVAIAQSQLDPELEVARGALAAMENPRHGVRRAGQRQLRIAHQRVAYLESLKASLQDGAPSQKPFLWPVHFHEVVEEQGGFDIVLANPPYVRQEGLDPGDQIIWEFAFPEVHSGTADLLVYFYCRAIQLLKARGQLAFITSNKYMRAAYGEQLRTFLPANLQLRYVIDFGDLPIFSVAAYPAVVIGQRVVPEPEGVLVAADMVYPIRKRLADRDLPVNLETVRVELEELPALLEEAAIRDFPQSLLRAEGWILEEPALVRLLDRLILEGTPLAEHVNRRMYNGVKTGLNDAFVLSPAEREEIIQSDPATAEIIKPWVRGRDIGRWHAVPERYLLCTYRGIDIEAYPGALEYLEPFKERLSRRDQAGTDYPWWELSRPRNEHYLDYARPKIIFSRFTNRPKFSYDDAGLFHTDSCYSCACDDPALLAVLNSRVCWWILTKLCTPLQNGYYQLFIQFLARLPVPEKLEQVAEVLRDLVGEVLESTQSDSEELIEHIVATAYELSEDEERLVNDWFKRMAITLDDDLVLAEADD